MSSLKNNEMVKKEMVLSAGTSSNINITAPDSLDVSLKNSNSQSNASETNSETDLGKGSKSLIIAPSSNPEGFLTLAGPFTLKSEEEHTEPVIETDWDTEGTYYGSDEEPNEEQEEESEEEPEEVKEWRRKLAYYSELLRKTRGPQTEERTEVKRQRTADKPSSGMSPESELRHHLNNVKEYCNKAVEEANYQGFVYGIVLEDDRVESGYSENLAELWNETKFEQTGPAEANKWLAEEQKKTKLANNNKPQKKTCHSLMQIPDATMGDEYMPPKI